MARTIAVISGKGGVGKTTVAINLAAALAKKFNRRVTVIDCNVTTSHLGLHLGMYYHPVSLNKVLRGEAHIHQAVHDHHSGIRVVPASLSITDLKGVDISRLSEKVEALDEHNDFVILDSGPGLGREAMSCIKAAEEVIYVTTPYTPAVMDVVRCKEVVSELGIKELGLVVNMVERERHEMTNQEIEQITRLPVISTVPYERAVKKSLAEKVPVVVLKPSGGSSRAFHRLAATVVGESAPEVPSLQSLLERIGLGRLVRAA